MSSSNVCPQLIAAENVFSLLRSAFAFLVSAPSIFASTRAISRWTDETETRAGGFLELFFLPAGIFDITLLLIGLPLLTHRFAAGSA
jgi:hypothetical protein